MAKLTVTQASAVNHLVGWLLAGADRYGDKPNESEARAAAELLVDHAHQSLSAGLMAEDVRRRWPRPSARRRK